MQAMLRFFITLATVTLVLTGLLTVPAVRAQTALATAGKTELLWLGQAGFRIKTPGARPS